MRLGLLLFAVLLGQSEPAFARASPPDPKILFAVFTNSQGYKNYLQLALNNVEIAPLRGQCPSLTVLDFNKYIILDPPTFVPGNGNYNIDTGKWIAKVVVDRCGTRTIRRLLLEAIPGANQIKPTGLLPGDFRGNLKLEVDAKRIVLPGVMARAHCNDWSQLYVLDVNPTSESTKAGWSETWTVQACAKSMLAHVVYGRKPNGMEVTSSVEPAR